LIELVVVSLVLPIVIGGLTLALVSLFTLQNSVANSQSASADAQTSSAFFEQDVHDAAYLTTSPSVGQCGGGTQLLGLEWNYNATTQSFLTVVTYASVQVGSGYQLVRQSCTSGISSSPTSSMIVVTNLSPTQPPPTVSPNLAVTQSVNTSTWVPTYLIATVDFDIQKITTGNLASASFEFHLTGVPNASGSAGSFTGVNQTTSNFCGFATPGTGTYASSLCFVDLTPFNVTSPSTAPTVGSKSVGTCPTGLGANTCFFQPATGCTQISEGIANTPYILSFCLSTATTPITGGAPSAGSVFSSCSSMNPAYGVLASPSPTYAAPPTSEAFLGNNGFYAGIPGNPALYQCVDSGSTTAVTLSNISLLDSNGGVVTGWQFVTGDAESTDPGESLTWTSNQVLTDLPDSSVSAYGNACWSAGNLYLTGLGTNTVSCSIPSNGWSSDKTGTLMLSAPAPTTMNVKMIGGGLEGVFFGVLLP
jgi:hypothetical protein